MKKFSNYDKVEVNEFKQTEKLNVGGHYCKILDVNIEKLNNGSEQLSFKIDIDSPDEQAGFYSRKFKEDADKDPMTAKWKGYYKMFLPNDDGSENDAANMKKYGSYGNKKDSMHGSLKRGKVKADRYGKEL